MEQARFAETVEEEKLAEYVKKCLLSGFTKEGITRKLLLRGWPIQIIEGTFRRVILPHILPKITPKPRIPSGDTFDKLSRITTKRKLQHLLNKPVDRLSKLRSIVKEKPTYKKGPSKATEKYILDQLKNGFTRAEIKEILFARGNSSAKINTVFKSLNNSFKESLNELDTYIARQSKKGFSKARIKKRILSEGWPKGLVEEAFQKIR